MPRPTWVYCLVGGRRLTDHTRPPRGGSGVKVGYTCDLERRLYQYREGRRHPRARFAGQWSIGVVTKARAYQLEQFIHKHLRFRFPSSGEAYYGDPRAIVAATESLVHAIAPEVYGVAGLS